MWKCVGCGKDNQDNRDYCWSCTTGRDGSPPRDLQAFEFAEKRPVTQPSSSPQQPLSTPSQVSSQSLPSPIPETLASGFASGLRICGGVDLIVGIIGALVIMSNAPSEYSGSRGYYFGLAIAVAFQGVLFCVLFNVIAEISETLRAILYRLSNNR